MTGMSFHDPTSIANLGREATTLPDEIDCDESDADSSTSSCEDCQPRPKQNKLLTEDEYNMGHTVSEECAIVIKDQRPHLRLSCIQMATFDAQILGLPWLTELALHRNQLESLPSSIARLRLLTHLRVTHNLLTKLPDEVGELAALELLDVGHNQLCSLPESVANLCQLRTCMLGFNHFAELPVPLAKLSNLQELFLEDNPPLRSLGSADSFMGFQSLRLEADNAPPLVASWKGLAPQCPAVSMKWHKVFPDEVLDHVYLGSLRTAQEQRVYEDLGITHVLTCGRDMNVVIGNGMDHLVLNLADTVDEDLSQHLQKGVDYIIAVEREGGKVLVHCFAGLSRSASIVCAYLIQKNHWTVAQALNFVRLARPAAQPNSGFMAKLRLFQQAYGIPDVIEGKEPELCPEPPPLPLVRGLSTRGKY
uniref:protein-tyrosine-phosphatase n=1 Tax=Eutreptiella gymnastica TaxID=73025 RepID=A0A7S1NA92_9EUGL|mmetsp:Transcript_144964/g.252839  ORF Transcript_144964/g.252839 Transcript_144964/m.252839 type:complete len:421 (+) Transcript_144964:164-1426(+)